MMLSLLAFYFWVTLWVPGELGPRQHVAMSEVNQVECQRLRTAHATELEALKAQFPKLMWKITPSLDHDCTPTQVQGRTPR